MKVADFRLSSLWVEACPELVGADDHGRFGPLVRPAAYCKLFNDLLGADNDPLISLPWPRSGEGSFPGHNEFWNDYALR
jgi:hypothetical protein